MSKCLRCTFPKEGPAICIRCHTPKGQKPAPAVADENPTVSIGENLAPSAALSDGPATSLPAHSRLGASSAERWMNCVGSASLIELVTRYSGFEEEDPDYRVDGVNNHHLAAHCLDNELDCWQTIGLPGFDFVDMSAANAVQTYLDYVRSRPNVDRRRVEHKMYRPDIHPLFYGTLDCEIDFFASEAIRLEIVDYKNGAGVVVEADENEQLMYYVNGVLDERQLIGSDRVKMTIVQPNAYHPDGPIRSSIMTVHQLREWRDNKLVPAMQEADPSFRPDLLTGADFKLGSWCRFCPVKTVCPAFDSLAHRILAEGSCSYEEAQQLKMLIKAVEQDEYRNLMNGEPGTGGKLVFKRVDRVWKDEAPVLAKFGQSAIIPAKTKSPAQIEELPGGKTFVAEWAYKPEAGLTVAPLNDKRSAVRPKDAEGVFGAAVQKILDNVL